MKDERVPVFFAAVFALGFGMALGHWFWDGSERVYAGNVLVPVFSEPDAPPVLLKDFEDGQHYGARAAIQVGGAVEGERCLAASTGPEEPATTMLNTAALERTHLGFWAKADRACGLSVAAQNHAGGVGPVVALRQADASGLTGEWRFFKTPFEALGVEDVLHLRFYTDVLAEIQVDEIVAFTPAAAEEPVDHGEPGPVADEVTTFDVQVRVTVRKVVEADGSARWEIRVDGTE